MIRRHILTTTAAHRYTLDDAPARPLVIVLGARVSDKKPSHMLEDRLRAALALHESGRGETLLVSGANRRGDDEVDVMRRWLEDRGVSPDAIRLDPGGLRTFDSMVRAKTVFGAERATVVSQEFHVPRAVYIGRTIGLDTIGVAAPAGYDYPRSLTRHNARREFLAQIRAWLDLHVLGTEPAFGKGS